MPGPRGEQIPLGAVGAPSRRRRPAAKPTPCAAALIRDFVTDRSSSAVALSLLAEDGVGRDPAVVEAQRRRSTRPSARASSSACPPRSPSSAPVSTRKAVIPSLPRSGSTVAKSTMTSATSPLEMKVLLAVDDVVSRRRDGRRSASTPRRIRPPARSGRSRRSAAPEHNARDPALHAGRAGPARWIGCAQCIWVM